MNEMAAGRPSAHRHEGAARGPIKRFKQKAAKQCRVRVRVMVQIDSMRSDGTCTTCCLEVWCLYLFHGIVGTWAGTATRVSAAACVAACPLGALGGEAAAGAAHRQHPRKLLYPEGLGQPAVKAAGDALVPCVLKRVGGDGDDLCPVARPGAPDVAHRLQAALQAGRRAGQASRAAGK